LPGLEAMNPDSAFLKILNNPAAGINGPLTVISGNCGVKLNLKALLVIAGKLFYMRDNDLVVDTRSMYCGTKRNNGIQYFFDEGPEVDHVHYFKNKKTQGALLLALQTNIDKIPGFTELKQVRTAEGERILGLEGGEVFCDKVSGNKPIAILLPGIMGSNLEQKNKKIWINYIRFLAGELSAWSSVASTERTTGPSATVSGVGTSCRPCLVNSGRASRSRRRRRALLTAGWLSPRRSAAPPTLPVSRSASRTRSKFRSRFLRFML
jgi:hypothetical protein